MPIKQLTPKAAIKKALDEKIKNIETAITYKMASIGESGTNTAKETRGYTDRTSNLVSSTGYVLVKDGKVAKEPSFEQHDPGVVAEDTANVKYDGADQGEQFAKEMAGQMPAGIGIVVVAGMDYAGAVEAKGLNVLAVSELQAKEQVEDYLKTLKR